MVAGTWFFDNETSTLYTETTGSTNPQTDEEMIVKYRFFFGNGPTAASWDLTDTGTHVQYEGRIQLNPGYKQKIGIDQGLISLIGNGTLKLINTDGDLDEIFDTIIFQNKDVTIFSWNRDLDFSERRIEFKGVVTNKRYDKEFVTFLVKDQLFALEQEIPQNPYTEDDNVNTDIIGRYKRWLYGRVDGLLLQSIDQIGKGYTISGTASGNVSNGLLDGTGTAFLSEMSPGDTVLVGTQEFEIETIESDTQATLGSIPEFPFSASVITLVPEIATTVRNRDFQVADHACAKLTKTLVSVIQFNRVELNNVVGINEGDFLEFSTGERLEVKNTAPGNIVVLRQNLIVIPSVSSSVIRQPIQRLFVEGKDVKADSFSITITSSGTTVSVDSTIEFDLARTRGLAIDLTFTNGSRKVTYAGEKDLTEILKPRDFIRPTDILFSTFFEVLSVADGFNLTGTMTATTNSTTVIGTGTLFDTELSPGDQIVIHGETFTIDTITDPTTMDLDENPSFDFTDAIARIEDAGIIELRLVFSDPNHTGAVEGKLPNYIGDATILSAEVLGRTENNEPDGTWIQTAAQVCKDLVNEAGLTDINTASFTQGSIDNSELISNKVPLSPTDSLQTIKEVANLVTRSTKSSLPTDNNQKIKFKVLNVKIPDDALEIFDNDVINWSVVTTNGRNIRNTIILYRHKDIDRDTLEPGTLIERYTFDFVEKYIGTNKTQELDIYLYDTTAASVMSHRVAYLNSLSRADIELETDLRLEDVEIGDTIIVSFTRLYKRFGDSTSRKKALMVIGKQVNGQRTKLSLSDLGNVFNRSSIITPNTASDFASATEDEKLKFGYITDNNGITNDDEDTQNIHRIS